MLDAILSLFILIVSILVEVIINFNKSSLKKVEKDLLIFSTLLSILVILSINVLNLYSIILCLFVSVGIIYLTYDYFKKLRSSFKITYIISLVLIFGAKVLLLIL